MADYRFSAKPIKRSAGQSAVASAAYRSAMRLTDERTGITHNYTRKHGVIHAEILAPDQTPKWMFDRAELWNAVEKVERRKDAQLAREVQLSLPHELNDEQRLELVRDFVQEQFVSRGMVADIALHHPDKQSDERNHHAHVMLTLRQLTADGFGKKDRTWNNTDLLQQWRVEWEQHQNRMLERHGYNARVDHRSYEERGIDQEPTQHMGQAVHQMEMRGEFTRVGDKNRAIQVNNAQRAKDRAYHAVVSAQLAMVKADLNREHENQRQSFADLLREKEVDLHVRHRQERDELKEHHRNSNADLRQQIISQLQPVTDRLDNARGLKKFARDLTGQTTADRATVKRLQKALQAVKVSEQAQRVELQRRQILERERFKIQSSERKQKFERGLIRSQQGQKPEGTKMSFKDRLRASYNRSSAQPSNDNTRARDKPHGNTRKPQ